MRKTYLVLRLSVKVIGDKMFRTYVETVDMNTTSNKPSLLAFHTPVGDTPYKFLEPCFRMFKKYRYLGMDVSIHNAASLPLDIQAFAIDGGTSNADPRDVMNPIMFKGCHGNDLGQVLDHLYAGLNQIITDNGTIDSELAENILSEFYYTALGDNTWRKAPINSTMRLRGLHPLVYALGTNFQINGSFGDTTAVTDGTAVSPYENGSPLAGSSLSANSRAFQIENADLYRMSGSEGLEVSESFKAISRLFTTKTIPLGWQDTMNVTGVYGQTNPESVQSMAFFDKAKVNKLPKIFMGILMLPPAMRSYQMLRINVRHKFAFRDYRGITEGACSPDSFPVGADVDDAPGYENAYTAL